MINTAASFLHGAVALAVAGLVVGMVAGAVHFVSLRWNTLYFAGGHPAIAFAIQVARLVLTAAILFLLARAGAFALLAGTGGFIWTRSIALDLGRVRS